MRLTIGFVTRPVGKASVQVVGDVPAKFAADLANDLNRAVKGIKVDASPIADGIAKGAKDGAAEADRAFDHLADQLNTTFAEIGRDADRAFEHVEQSADAAADRVDRATSKMQRDARGRFVKMGTDAGAAGEKIGSEFQAGGEVAERALRELARAAAREFSEIVNKASTAAVGTSARWVSAWSVIKGAALAASAASVAALTAITAFGLKSAAALEQTTIGLESLLGSADAAKSFIKELQAFAAATPFEFADVADASRRILAFGTSVGITRKQVIPTLTTIGDLVSVLGGTSENIQSVIRALGQMASKGKLSQEEILQLAEALPGFNANAAIASALGLSVADTLKLITAGGVSAKVGIDALLKGMRDFPGAAGAMAKQAQTLNGVFSTFKDTIAIALTDAFTPVIPQIKETLTAITPVIGDAVKILAPALGGFLAKTLPLIASLIAAVSPLLGVFTDLAGVLLTTLTPALAPLGQVATDLVKALSPLAVELGTVLGQAVKELVDSGALQEIIKQVVALSPALIDLLIALTPLLGPLAKLLALSIQMQTPWIQLVALVVDFLAVKGLAPAISAVADAFNHLFKILTPGIKAFTDIRNWPAMFKAFGAVVGPALAKAGHAIGDFFSDIGDFFAAIPGQVGHFLASLPGIMADAIRAAFDAALHAIGFGIGFLIGAFLAFPPLLVKTLAASPHVLAQFFDALWHDISDRASAAWDAIVHFAGAALDAIPHLLDAALDAIPHLLDAAGHIIEDRFNTLVDFLFSIPGRISALADLMVKAGAALIKGLFSGLSSAGGFAGDLAGSVFSTLKNLINKVIEGINSGIASVDDKLPGISLPRIPKLAQGGLTVGGGLAELHPRELVLPLDDRRVVDLLARALSTAAGRTNQSTALAADGGPGSIEVRVFIGDTELTDIVNVVVSERDRKTKARVKAGAGVRR